MLRLKTREEIVVGKTEAQLRGFLIQHSWSKFLGLALDETHFGYTFGEIPKARRYTKTHIKLAARLKDGKVRGGGTHYIPLEYIVEEPDLEF